MQKVMCQKYSDRMANSVSGQDLHCLPRPLVQKLRIITSSCSEFSSVKDYIKFRHFTKRME